MTMSHRVLFTCVEKIRFDLNWAKRAQTSSANQIAEFFDQLYLPNHLMIVSDFLHGVRQP